MLRVQVFAAVAALASTHQVCAQQRYYHPRTLPETWVVVQPQPETQLAVQPAPVPATQSPAPLQPTPAGTATSVPNAPCDGAPGNAPPCDDCATFGFPIQVRNVPSPDCKNVTEPGPEIPVNIVPGNFPRRDGNITPYYNGKFEFKANTTLPVIKRDGYKSLLFKAYTYTKECCQITVCVPCRCDTTYNAQCTTETRLAQMVARRITRSGLIDIYVINEPGMPDQYLVHRNLSLVQAQAIVGSPSIVFTP